MPLTLRILHHRPQYGSRAWDAILMDERQNVRLHTDDGGFIDITIMGGEHYHPENIKPKHDHKVLREKARARRRLRNKRKKANRAAR